MPKKASAGWAWPPLKQALYHRMLEHPAQDDCGHQPARVGWGEHHPTQRCNPAGFISYM